MMRSLSTRALGQPSETSPTLGGAFLVLAPWRRILGAGRAAAARDVARAGDLGVGFGMAALLDGGSAKCNGEGKD